MPKVVLQVLLEPEELEAVHTLAEDEGRSDSGQGRQLIREALATRGK